MQEKWYCDLLGISNAGELYAEHLFVNINGDILAGGISMGYARYNPITNLQSYSHTPFIHFENAGSDSYVPSEAAQRFISSLKQSVYHECPTRLSIVEHPNREHGFHIEFQNR